MLTLGWFSTGRGPGSRGLLTMVLEAIKRGELDAGIPFVFCNRDPGEHEGSDQFMALVRSHGIPLVTFSSRRFRRSLGAPSIDAVRLDYDREVMARIAPYRFDLGVLAGYMLIVGPEMCRRYTMLNLHPALPGGPAGTWQEVIWQLIAQGARGTGAMVHLAAPEVDRGQPATYVSFPIRGAEYDALWRQVEGRSVQEMQAREGEELALFQRIRQEGVKRERPLLLETLKAFASGRLRVVRGTLVDAKGTAFSAPLCLNDEVERAVARASAQS